ncbi:MAG: NAD kinase [Saprospiraceae bacterium]|nr:NAD kinase [Saprospiraceae bacterium]
MKIGIFGKTLNEESVSHFQNMISMLEKKECKLFFYKPFYEKIQGKLKISEVFFFENYIDLKQKVDVLFSMGGDGTLLDTITLLRDSGIPVLGINLGRLGFLSSVSKEEIEKAIGNLISGNYTLDKRTLLRLETKSNIFGDVNFAMNEIAIHKIDSPTLIVIKVYVNEHFLNSYWADGIIISTPTGSTGYSLSCNGPIVAPGSETFIINPIASHNLTVRPIVIPDSSEIRLTVDGRNKNYSVGLDSRSISFDSTLEMTVKKENFKINLIDMPEKDFFTTIREKLKWGLDVRN